MATTSDDNNKNKEDPPPTDGGSEEDSPVGKKARYNDDEKVGCCLCWRSFSRTAIEAHIKESAEKTSAREGRSKKRLHPVQGGSQRYGKKIHLVSQGPQRHIVMSSFFSTRKRVQSHSHQLVVVETRLETLDTLFRVVWFGYCDDHMSSFWSQGETERRYLSDFPEDGDGPFEEVTVRDSVGLCEGSL